MLDLLFQHFFLLGDVFLKLNIDSWPFLLEFWLLPKKVNSIFDGGKSLMQRVIRVI